MTYQLSYRRMLRRSYLFVSERQARGTMHVHALLFLPREGGSLFLPREGGSGKTHALLLRLYMEKYMLKKE